MTVYECPDCVELFTANYIGGGVPGGKERETIDCPTCRCTVGSEVTSAVIQTEKLSDQEKINFLRSCHVSGRRRLFAPDPVTQAELQGAQAALERWQQLDSALGYSRLPEAERRLLEAERAKVSTTYRLTADRVMAEQFQRLNTTSQG